VLVLNPIYSQWSDIYVRGKPISFPPVTRYRNPCGTSESDVSRFPDRRDLSTFWKRTPENSSHSKRLTRPAGDSRLSVRLTRVLHRIPSVWSFNPEQREYCTSPQFFFYTSFSLLNKMPTTPSSVVITRLNRAFAPRNRPCGPCSALTPQVDRVHIKRSR
jgi:hypothetical protein